MFQTKELERLDSNYFVILQKNAHSVTLQSKNTGHCWHILHLEYPTFKSCTIYHNHKMGADYHTHGHAPTLAHAISLIMDHDIFQMNGRKRVKNINQGCLKLKQAHLPVFLLYALFSLQFIKMSIQQPHSFFFRKKPFFHIATA